MTWDTLYFGYRPGQAAVCIPDEEDNLHCLHAPRKVISPFIRGTDRPPIANIQQGTNT